MSVRDIHVRAVTAAVKKLCIDANLEVEPDMRRVFEARLTTERSEAGRHVLACSRTTPSCADAPHPVLPGHGLRGLLRGAARTCT